MMNLQELQTILTNKLPIKIFLINNNGYHSIRLTQNNLFKEHCKIGIGPESGDLSFPEFKKIAEAFGYKYYSASSNEEMKKTVDEVLKEDGPVFFNSSLGRNGAKSSSGGLTSVPSSNLLVLLLGSHTCLVSVNISQNTGPSSKRRIKETDVYSINGRRVVVKQQEAQCRQQL